MTRFTAADLKLANEIWGCNCGPGAAAAVCDLTLDEVRPHFAKVGFEAKCYTNPTMMVGALKSIGRPWYTLKPGFSSDLPWPRYGLARVQWEGTWTRPGVPMAARYRQTHWVGAHTGSESIGIFDINAMEATSAGDGWVALEEWDGQIVPFILKDHNGATGRWHLTHIVEIERK